MQEGDLRTGRLTVHRLKGSLSGVYPMQPDTHKLLKAYLRSRKDVSPYLFVSNRQVPISRYALWHRMQHYGAAAGLPPEKRTFHILKHSIATHLLDAGLDSRVLIGQTGRNRLFLQAFHGGRDRCGIFGKSHFISRA
jgi:site-specific recombinase XerD